VPHEASLMYAKNMIAFLLHVVHDGELELDLEDEIIAGTLVTREGKIVNARVLGSLEVDSVPGA
jgi:NAD(P) transhydrogenase subunit alpha